MSTFNEYRSAHSRARIGRVFAEALQIARDAHGSFPREHARTWYWQACLHSLLGDAEEAIAALRAGLREGVWFSPAMLDADVDLEPVRRRPEFAAIRGECERLRGIARETSRPQCMVVSPSSALWDQQTLLALHMKRDTARGFFEHWRPLVDQGWTLVVPQSSQPCDSASFCWDDRDLALREIRQHLEDCRGKRGLDPGRMVIAGASQAAPLALEVANEWGLPWLCVIPTFPPGYDVAPLAAVPEHTRGVFFLGENDPANARAKPVIAYLEGAGARVETRVMEGVGHHFPAGFAERAAEALATLF